VAIVGISDAERFGGKLYNNLASWNYGGPIYGINPRRDTLFGQPCYDALRDLPERPDCALIAVANARLLESLEEAAACDIPAAVIFASAHSDQPGPALQEQLAEVARAHGMVVCGPNCMGFVSSGSRLPVSGYDTNPNTPGGHATLITHSGSVWDAFLQNDRGVGFNYIVSSGNEMVTSMADYMQHALDDPATRVIGLFVETVRDPETFIAALAEAAERDIPVVALKTGRSERGAEFAQAHSGALAGEDAAYAALFERYGVCRARSIDELMDSLELFASGVRPSTGAVSAILDSGGQRALMVDLAESESLPFASLEASTLARLSEVLEPGLEPANPLDAWGTGNGADSIYAESLLALDADPGTGLTLFAVDLYPSDDDPPFYPAMVAPLLDELHNPLVWLVHLSAAASETQMRFLRELGVPVLMGTETGLRAVKHLLDYQAFRTRDSAGEYASSQRPGAIAPIRERLRGAEHAWGERESKALLREYGLVTAPEELATSETAVLRAAEQIGYPVVLKTAAGHLHKSEQGGVRLDLGNAAELAAAYRDFATRLGPEVLVSRMVGGGVEVLLGIVNDPQFGPMLTLGMGGIFVEVMKDVRMLALPTSPGAVRAALEQLRGAALLRGARGRPAIDFDAVTRAAMGLATLAADLGNEIAEVDVNPLIASPEGAVVVDALVVPKTAVTRSR
jgi:acyl-CoA synthetase (NDP forming)